MNANLQIFSNPQFGKVRTLAINNNPYFVGNDIATCLGYSYPKDAIRDNVDEEDKLLIQLSDIQEGEQTPPPHMKGSKVMAINESGVYSLVFGSKLPTAKQFKRWVTNDVLPSIRKTGGYIIEKEGDTDEDLLARAFLVAQNKIKERDQRIDNLEEQDRLNKEELRLSAPKVLFANAITGASTNITINDMAKLLRQNGIDIGQNRLYEWLVKNKYLICRKRWSKKKDKYENDYMPTQKAADLEIFFVGETPIVGSSGSFIRHTVKVNGKGQSYFINKFLKNKLL